MHFLWLAHKSQEWMNNSKGHCTTHNFIEFHSLNLKQYKWSGKDTRARTLLETHYCISHSPLNKAFIQFYISRSLKQRGSKRACYSWEQHFVTVLKHSLMFFFKHSQNTTHSIFLKWFPQLTTASKDTEQHGVFFFTPQNSGNGHWYNLQDYLVCDFF